MFYLSYAGDSNVQPELRATGLIKGADFLTTWVPETGQESIHRYFKNLGIFLIVHFYLLTNKIHQLNEIQKDGAPYMK